MSLELHLNESDLTIIQSEIEGILRRSSDLLIKNYKSSGQILSRLDNLRDRLVQSGIVPETVVIDLNHARELAYLEGRVVKLTKLYEESKGGALVDDLSHYNRRLAETRMKAFCLNLQNPVVSMKFLPAYLLPKIICDIENGIKPTEIH